MSKQFPKTVYVEWENDGDKDDRGMYVQETIDQTTDTDDDGERIPVAIYQLVGVGHKEITQKFVMDKKVGK